MGLKSILGAAEIADFTDPDEVDAAKAWLLSYNEDDDAAMAAIRDGIRAWKPGE